MGLAGWPIKGAEGVMWTRASELEGSGEEFTNGRAAGRQDWTRG